MFMNKVMRKIIVSDIPNYPLVENVNAHATMSNRVNDFGDHGGGKYVCVDYRK